MARAIFSTNYHPDDGEFANRMFENDDHPQEKRRAYRAARAALEAMRDPPPSILRAIRLGPWGRENPPQHHQDLAELGWLRGIDAALKGEEV